MKSLTEFLVESIEQIEHNNVQVNEDTDSTETSCDITFDFTGIEDADDTVKELQKVGMKAAIPVAVDGTTKVTISFSKDTLDAAKELIDLLKNTVNVATKSTRRASDESYAQKCQKLEAAVKELDNFVESCETMDDDSNKPAVDNAELEKEGDK